MKLTSLVTNTTLTFPLTTAPGYFEHVMFFYNLVITFSVTMLDLPTLTHYV